MSKMPAIPKRSFSIEMPRVPSHSNHRDTAAFSRGELLVVVATVAVLAVTLLPALAHVRPDSQVFQCLNNHRRLMQAWNLYAADYGDRVPNNFTLSEVVASISNGKLDNWANNVLTWSVGSSVEDRSNTNIAWVTNGVFGKYTGSDPGVYQCPADYYVSVAQKRAGWTRRNRSLSMNGLFGRTDHLPSSSTGRSWYDPTYRQFLKTTDVPFTAGTWVTIDEHADSINEGFFIVPLNATSWGDIPASYHNGACSFSFADGHAEEHKWLSSTSKYPVKFSSLVKPFDPAGKQDYRWYIDRTGFILLR